MLRIVRRSLAGHSKWANIRHKKGGKDAAKADQFQKLAKVIETSSKLAGGDRSHPALASALSRAKDARMPKKTVDAAVSRGGADKTAGAGLEELVYEAVWKSKFYRAFVLIVASTSTLSTRRLLDSVAVPVPHRSTQPARQRHRRERT